MYEIVRVPEKDTRKKVLFVRFSSLGDVILTTGVIREFKRQFPDILCDVFTSNDFASVFSGLDFINEVITINRKEGIKSYAKVVQERVNGYDYIVDLHSNLRTFLLKFMSASKFLRYKKDSSERRNFVKKRIKTERIGMHVVLKYAESLIPLGFTMPTLEELRPVVFSDKKEQAGIVINPFASKPTKQWDKFPLLAERLVSEGHKVTVIGQGDFPDIYGVKLLTGKTSLNEMFDVLAENTTLITTDSGPLHAGVALNKKVIAIFGSTTSDFGFAPDFQGCSIVEKNNLSCRPCHVHGQDVCPEGHFECMKNISVDDVLRLV